ncbi:CT214 family putative inclusion membrane protein [Chlamydia sp. 04-14]|uniref:CT214 family putative inclusion membrane protein n=1 Tax=Chlamydia TaxID=810 RepID=UPI002FC63C10
MSQPTINPNSHADNHTEPPSITPKQKDTACKIRQLQIISLISAVAAAVLLLTILILQLIPGAHVAFSIILGLALVVATAISLIFFASYFLKIRKVLFELSQASTELREAFANFSLDLIRNIEPQRITRPPRYGLRARPRGPRLVSTQVSSPTPGLIPTPASTPVPGPTPPPALTPTPQVSTTPPQEQEPPETPMLTPGEGPLLPPEVPSQVDEGAGPGIVPEPVAGPSEEMDVDALFQSNLLRLLDLAEGGGSYPSIDKHPQYKKNHQNACKLFSNFCKGVARFWDKVRLKQIPATNGELLSMFVPPIFGRDNHPILSITCNGEDVFSSEIYGAFWLHDALKDPKQSETLFDIIRVLKKSNQSIEDVRDKQTAYTASLISLNVLLSGWCLCNQSLAANIVGSVQSLGRSQEDEMMIFEMLNSGNILGALVFIHGDRNPNMKAIMRINDLDSQGRPLPDPQNAIDILYENIDPYSVRAITVVGDLAGEDLERDNNLIRESQRIFERLGESLPVTATGLGYDIWNGGNEDLNARYDETKQFLSEHPPTSTSMIFSFLRAVRGAPKLQSRIEKYLPYSGKKAAGFLLSTLILGGYFLGLFTYRQIDGLCEAIGISERDLMRLILSRKIAGAILPKLL